MGALPSVEVSKEKMVLGEDFVLDHKSQRLS